MDCLCIPWFSSDKGILVDDALSGDKNGSEPSNREKVDLLSDEGATLQDDLWRLALQEKLHETNSGASAFYQELATEATFNSSLQSLTEQYSKHGFSKKLPRVKTILASISPFTAAITTMVQSHPEVAALVWGSVQLVLQCVMRFTSIFDETGHMLHELSKALPRFQTYVKVLHTPRLHQALREVYGAYIEFCFAVIKFIRSNTCYALVKVQWSGIGRKFDETKNGLNATRCNFDAETHLADVQVQARRHREILDKLPVLPIAVNGDPVTTGLAARNVMFTGRDAVLSQLHLILEQSFKAPEVAQRLRRSCVLHGVGGMGKTETALEYTYRYRACYSHIFWLHAESNAVLLDSFLAATRGLGLDQESTDINKTIQIGLEWFQSTANPWLLILDNTEEASTIRKFWPAGVRGAIIVTTQNPDLVNITDDAIHLQPMQAQEGSSLIQRYLRRGGSEQAAAEALSEDLGGLPLAIAHFAGYVARSQCTIKHISESLRERFKSSQIWNLDGVASISTNVHTLATVWDLAWQRLSSDSQKLLSLIAFLNPDSIPEDLFVGDDSDMNPQGWQYWDIHRFNEAVRNLCERHLVERDVYSSGVSLRTHRALQRSILHRLDAHPEQRQHVFDEVVSIVRKAYPPQNVAKRGDSSHWRSSEKYLSQVISINTAFVQSSPKILDNLEFAALLRDAGYFLLNYGVQVDAVAILETAKGICSKLLPTRPCEARAILADSLGTLQVYYQYMGIDGRHRALQTTTQALKLRVEQMANIPDDQWTSLDNINFARSSVDLGVTYTQLNMMEQAGQGFQNALEYYRKAGTEETLAARFGLTYSFQMLVLSTRQEASEARELARRCYKLVEQAVGAENHLTLQTKFCTALVAFTIGDTAEALQLHKEVFESRFRLRGKDHQETLASQYNLAVAYQGIGDLENAERCLRKVLEHSCVTLQWRDEDVARTKFRLSVVLRAQNRPSEATSFREEAIKMRKAWAHLLPTVDLTTYTDEDDMELFDIGVTLWHGRTTSIWSNGRVW